MFSSMLWPGVPDCGSVSAAVGVAPRSGYRMGGLR